MQKKETIEALLEEKVRQYNRPSFIENDPILIPHRFSKKQDIEIAAFFAATFAWGLRKTIINKCTQLLDLMDNSPYDFVRNYQEKDLKAFEGFKHRTFNDTDLLYFIDFLGRHYHKHDSLEVLFSTHDTTKKNIAHFHDTFFDAAYAPSRTKKHVGTPERKSACKRLNMFLRWMVRKDDAGVDFGIWKNISAAALICPLDVHVERVSKQLGLLERKQTDWQAAEELTKALREFDARDPVKYDFALFGLGLEKFAQ